MAGGQKSRSAVLMEHSLISQPQPPLKQRLHSFVGWEILSAGATGAGDQWGGAGAENAALPTHGVHGQEDQKGGRNIATFPLHFSLCLSSSTV